MFIANHMSGINRVGGWCGDIKRARKTQVCEVPKVHYVALLRFKLDISTQLCQARLGQNCVRCSTIF